MRVGPLVVSIAVVLFAVATLSGSAVAVTEQPTVSDGPTIGVQFGDVPCDATCVDTEEPSDETLETCESDDGATQLTGC